jgi:putative membrane protein
VQEIIMLTHKLIAYKCSIGNNVQNLLRWFLAAALIACAIGAAPVVRADDKPITDNVFIQDSYTNAQTEIEMSRVALEKSANTRTKKLAKAIIKANSAANAQLRTLANTRKLTIPAQLDKDRQQQIEQLKISSRENFDSVYRQQMQQIHVAAIQLFDNVAKNPRADAELRVFASKRLPQFKKHQQMLEKIGGQPVVVTQRQPGA